MFLISDNIDSQMGLRLAGIEGLVVHNLEELNQALDAVFKDESIGILLLTSVVFDMDRSRLQELKLSMSKLLIVEVSDRHKSHDVQSMIDDTISKIVGEVL